MLSDPSVLEECSKVDLERQSQRLSWRIGEAFSHWFCSKIDLIILDQFDLRNSLSYLLTVYLVYLVYLSTAANFNFQRCFEHSAHDFQKSIMSPGIHPRASIFLQTHTSIVRLRKEAGDVKDVNQPFELEEQPRDQSVRNATRRCYLTLIRRD